MKNDEFCTVSLVIVVFAEKRSITQSHNGGYSVHIATLAVNVKNVCLSLKTEITQIFIAKLLT